MANITLFRYICFISIPSEISILSYSSIYISYKQSSQKTSLPSSSKTDLTIIVNIQSFNILFNDKSSSELNLILM